MSHEFPYFSRLIVANFVWGMVLSSPARSRWWLAMPLDARCTSFLRGYQQCSAAYQWTYRILLGFIRFLGFYWTYQCDPIWSTSGVPVFGCGSFRPGPCLDVRKSSNGHGPFDLRHWHVTISIQYTCTAVLCWFIYIQFIFVQFYSYYTVNI